MMTLAMAPSLPQRDVSIGLIADEDHLGGVVERVRAASLSVWISTANLKKLLVPAAGGLRRGRGGSYRSMLDVFDDLAGAGVELRILHASPPSRAFRDAFDRHPRLIRGGLELRQCPRVHLKAVVVDAEYLYVGSANWTGAGLGAKNEHRRNFEMGVVTRDPVWLDFVQATINRIWRGGHCGPCKLRDRCEAPLDL
jgi:phosphatidylserine/phosphatidylglycerophosphate/cardiolipin synthase-like enzyme